MRGLTAFATAPASRAEAVRAVGVR